MFPVVLLIPELEQIISYVNPNIRHISGSVFLPELGCTSDIEVLFCVVNIKTHANFAR
jgi:hypothetical protein